MFETPARIEPCFPEGDIPAKLNGLSVDIQQESAKPGQNLHPETINELVDLVRVINCHYSNLIEGHNICPRDIERTLAGIEPDENIRSLALEARAHIIVQRKIDEMYHAGTLPCPVSAEFLTWAHKAFYDEMPDEFRMIKHPDGSQKPIIPGQMRQEGDMEITVGRHFPPSSARVSAFIDYFEKRFRIATRSSVSRIIAIACAHHRFNYIHPFLDGNGRVSRLMSHAMALTANIGCHGLWSISRGLARGLENPTDYNRMMDFADSPRCGDRDGRGNLSLAALEKFCEWFMKVSLDQITFSTSMFDPERLKKRYCHLVDTEINDQHASNLISLILEYGPLERGKVHKVLQISEHTTHNTIARLVASGCLKSSSDKAPLGIAFPLQYRAHLFPGLFPVEIAPDNESEPAFRPEA